MTAGKTAGVDGWIFDIIRISGTVLPQHREQAQGLTERSAPEEKRGCGYVQGGEQEKDIINIKAG